MGRAHGVVKLYLILKPNLNKTSSIFFFFKMQRWINQIVKLIVKWIDKSIKMSKIINYKFAYPHASQQFKRNPLKNLKKKVSHLTWKSLFRDLTLSWRRPTWYRNQSIDLLCKLMDWFLYDNSLHHERVKKFFARNSNWGYNLLQSFLVR